jgi:hypothetical protein
MKEIELQELQDAVNQVSQSNGKRLLLKIQEVIYRAEKLKQRYLNEEIGANREGDL